jgi:flagellar hook-associated protein 2
VAGSSVDGLVSGLSTSDLINQLMQVESIPKQKLQAKVSQHQLTQSSLQQVNTKLKSLFTASEALTKPDTYGLTKATSSSDAVTASASGGAATGQLTFEVKTLARAHVVTAAFAAATTPAVDMAAGLSISINGGAAVGITVAADKNTPQGVAEAINAAGLNVKAAAVDTGSGIVLQLTSTKTGTANQFTVNGLTSTPQTATDAADASLRVGGTNPGAYTVTSGSNTFSNLMSGVTLTVSKLAPEVTVSVNKDVDGLAGKVQAMVDAANNALADISLKTNTSTTSTAPLKGNALVRQTASDILSAVASGVATTVAGVTSYQTFAAAGVQLDKSGRLTFNRDTFVAAYNKDPAGTQTLVQDGVAKNLTTVADGASDTTTGSITQILASGVTYETRLKAEIDNWDKRLELRKTALQKQFTGLEVALGKMKNQSSWLSGQLAGLH